MIDLSWGNYGKQGTKEVNGQGKKESAIRDEGSSL